MPIKFKYQAAAVPPPSNELTRRFGQNLVTQQKQQDFAKQQLGQQLGARDFQNATSNMSSYLQDLLDNGEIPDESVRRQVLGLKGGLDTVMGSGFTDDQRRHYLDQYRQAAARVVAGIQPKAKPTRDDELKGFLGPAYDDPNIRKLPWVPDGKGGFVVADIPQPEQPKLPEPPPPQPKTFGEYSQMEPDKARKMLADKVAEIRGKMEEGETLGGPWKSVEERAFYELEQPFKALQDRFGQPSAGVLVAPGLAQGGFARRNQPYIVGEQGPELFVPNVSGAVVPNNGLSAGGGQDGIARPSASGGNNPWASVLGGGQDGIARPSDRGYSSRVAMVDMADGRATYLNPDGTTYLGPMPTGGPQGSAWANPNLPVWRTEGQPYTFTSQPQVGDMRVATEGQAQPVANRSGAFNFDGLAQEVAQNNAMPNLPYNDLRPAAGQAQVPQPSPVQQTLGGMPRANIASAPTPSQVIPPATAVTPGLTPEQQQAQARWSGAYGASGQAQSPQTEPAQQTYTGIIGSDMASAPNVRQMLQSMSDEELAALMQSRNSNVPMSPDQAASQSVGWDQIMEDVRSQGQGGPMTPERMNAETDAKLKAIEEQRAAAAAAGRQPYQSRIDATRAEADAMSGKTDRAQAFLDGKLLPRSPQGERPSSMYDISDAQDKREAEQFAKNKEEYGKYKARRAASDAALQDPADPTLNAIDNPKTMKQDARKFSSEYQLYKRGGGTLSTRDYILQMAKQGQLSDDLKAQLENNYGMDLSDPALAKVEKQDVLSQQDTVKAEAQAKRDAEDTRRKYARGNINAQRGYRGAPNVTPPAATASVTQPPSVPSATGPYQGGYKYPGSQPNTLLDLPSMPIGSGQRTLAPPVAPPTAIPPATTSPAATPPTVAPALPQSPEPNFIDLEANAKDDIDKTIVRKMSEVYKQNQSTEVRSAIGMLFSDDKVQAAKAADYLKSVGIDLEQLTAESQYKGTGRGQIKTSPANNSSAKYGVGRGGVRTK